MKSQSAGVMKDLTLILYCLPVLLCAAAPALGGTEAGTLHVIVHGEADAKAHQRDLGFIVELQMNLAGVGVDKLDVPAPDFFELPVSKQISAISKAIDRSSTLAVLWLEDVPGDGVTLHLLTVSLGRMYVRVVQVPSDAGLETTLALATREILGLAYIVEEPPEMSKEALAPVTGEARESLVEKPSPKKAGPLPSLFISPSVSIQAGGSFSGELYPSSILGAGIGAGLRFSGWFGVSLKVRYLGGPFGDISCCSVHMQEVSGSLAVELGKEIGKVWIGAFAGVVLSYLEMRLESKEEEAAGEKTKWVPSFIVGPLLRWKPAKGFGLFASLGIYPLWKKIRFKYNGETVYSTGYVGWSLSLGVSYDFPLR
ncbi:MAG: hypothetical protein ABIJ56_13365 [Pseudomonadota bacterium]